MPAKLRSSVRPKTTKSAAVPFKKLESVPKTYQMVEIFTRDRDLLIVTDSETEYESEAEAPKSPVRVRLPRRVNLKRKLDENMNDDATTKRANARESKMVKPKRSTKSSSNRRGTLTRAAQRKEAELNVAKVQQHLERAAKQLFDLNSTVDFMDIVNL